MKKQINFNWNKTIKEMNGINDEEMPYALYSDTVCISEHTTFEDAEKAFNDEIKNNPDNEIDILSADGTISYLSYNPDNGSIYRDEHHI